MLGCGMGLGCFVRCLDDGYSFSCKEGANVADTTFVTKGGHFGLLLDEVRVDFDPLLLVGLREMEDSVIGI